MTDVFFEGPKVQKVLEGKHDGNMDKHGVSKRVLE